MDNFDEVQKVFQTNLLELLIKDAEYPFSGWDFSYIRDRLVSEPLTWSYHTKLLPLVRKVNSMLDMGTGGGEFLSSLAPFPKEIYATEAYEPNVPIAKKRLEPLGVKVIQIEEKSDLPFEDNKFELVINRHEWYSPDEIFRILEPEGVFVTQQVGQKNDSELRYLLTGMEDNEDDSEWDLNYATKQLESAGFQILEKHEVVGYTRIFDVGAIVFYLKAVPWELPNFTVEKYYDKLAEIQKNITRNRYIELSKNNHRFFISATK